MSPVVLLEKPSDDSDYDLFNSNGVNIYVKKGINPDNRTIKISLMKTFFSEKYVVSGI